MSLSHDAEPEYTSMFLVEDRVARALRTIIMLGERHPKWVASKIAGHQALIGLTRTEFEQLCLDLRLDDAEKARLSRLRSAEPVFLADSVPEVESDFDPAFTELHIEISEFFLRLKEQGWHFDPDSVAEDEQSHA
jgi:hypothetical protein